MVIETQIITKFGQINELHLLIFSPLIPFN